MTDETGIRDMPSLVIPPFPETQPTDAWIEDEDNLTKLPDSYLTSLPSSMSYTIPNSNHWSPLMHQRTYHIRSVFEDLVANMTYLVFELKKLRSSFPLDPKVKMRIKKKSCWRKRLKNIVK